MTDLSALAEKVEGLPGPCRETDVLIVQALYPDIGPCEPHCAGDTPIFWNDPLYKKPCPTLTVSLDAVVALIEKELPEWHWRVQGGNPDTGATVMSGRPVALLLRGREGLPFCFTKISADCATPVLALLAAALKAMETRKT